MGLGNREYEYVRGVVDGDEMTIEYRVIDGPAQSTVHDEDVSDFSEDDLKQCITMALSLNAADVDQLEIEYA